MDTAKLWKHILAELEVELGKSPVGLYFKNSQIVSFENNVVIISLVNKVALETVNSRYYQPLVTALERQTNQKVTLKFQIEDKKREEISLGGLFADSKIEDPPKIADHDFNYQKTRLSARYTLNTFVVGSTNNFAHAAALSIIKNPGKEYNPFFLYGGVGVGKTHLMQAIGNELYKINPNLKILYVSAETFMNDYIESLGPKTTYQFRKKYRGLDLLLIDDIQSISGKEATQDEIFNTFNALHQTEKQVVLTSDRRPEEIEKVESRIISRFMGGLTVDIQIPDFEMRTAIITEKLALRNDTWEREAIEYVAEQIESNIRELEGVINKINTGAKLNNQPVTLSFVKQLVGEKRSLEATKKSGVSPREIISTVAKQFGVKPSDILSESRSSSVVAPRQLAMYIMRKECGIKLAQVAKLLNRKDHTTVMHAVEKLELAYKNDPKVREQVLFLKRQIWG